MKRSNIKRTIRVSKRRSGGGRWIKTKAEKEEAKAEKARQELANQRATQFELDRAKLGEQGLAMSVMGILQQKQKAVAAGGSRVSKSKKRSGGGKRKGRRSTVKKSKKRSKSNCGGIHLRRRQRGGEITLRGRRELDAHDSCMADYNSDLRYDSYKETGNCATLHSTECGDWMGCMTKEGKCKFLTKCDSGSASLRGSPTRQGPRFQDATLATVY